MGKKILFLDANSTLISSIIYAKEIGCYTITCDNKPNNPGHLYSDKQYFISTYDIDNIYKVVEKEKIEGVVYFSSAHGLYAACRIIEKYSLPGFTLSIEETISDKYKFREFLRKNGFNTPHYTSVKDINNIDILTISKLKFPLIVKPVDGGGNRGISIINDCNDIVSVVDYALSESRVKNVILEEFIDSDIQINGDCLFIQGKLIFAFLGRYLYPNKDSLISYATIFGKNVIPVDIRTRVENEIQRIITKNNLINGVINIEIRLDKNNKIYFIEINPRHSGNRIYMLMDNFINIPMEHIAVDLSIEDITRIKSLHVNEDKYSAFCVLYSDYDGILDSIDISDELNKYIIKKDLFKKKGDKIKKFTLLKERLGLLHLIFPTEKELIDTFRNIKNLYKINLINDKK